jgi:cell division protein FtsL
VKPEELVSVLATIILALFIIDFQLKQEVATIGPDLTVLRDEVKKLQIINTQLEDEILEAQSLRVVLEKAKQMGFHEAEEKEYIYIR